MNLHSPQDSVKKQTICSLKKMNIPRQKLAGPNGNVADGSGSIPKRAERRPYSAAASDFSLSRKGLGGNPLIVQAGLSIPSVAVFSQRRHAK